MRNCTSCFRLAEAIDLKHDTIKRVAEELTHDCMDEIEKAVGPCYLQEIWLSSTEEQAR